MCCAALAEGHEDEADKTARQKSMAALVQPLTRSCLGCAIVFHASHFDWFGLLIAVILLAPTLRMYHVAGRREASDEETSDEPVTLRLDWLCCVTGDT